MKEELRVRKMSGLKRQRIVLPASRIILIIIVGLLFLFQAVVGLIEKGRYSSTVLTAYLVIGLLLVLIGVWAGLGRLRSHKRED